MRTLPAWAACALILAALPGLAHGFFRSGFEDGEPPNQVSTPGLGTNLETLEDFAAAYSFTNLFKQSRPWFTASQTVFDTGDADQLDLDANGWVQSLPTCTPDPARFCFARTVINSAGADYPNGQWRVTYEGSGTLTYGGAASLASRAPGVDLINVASDDIIIITLEATAAAPDHLKNIQVLPPGFDPAQASVPTFHPDFIAALAPYRTIRFMDWMRTNGGGFGGVPNPQVDFADRPRPDDARYTGESGVPLEVMIELANTVDAEPWFTIPHQASDDYVRQFAAQVKTQLDPGRRVYVEHSNEVWNSFPQGFDIEADGIANLLPVGCDPDPAQRAPGCPSDFDLRLNQHGLRTAQICALFREVYAEAPARDGDEIVCTLGAQAANSFTATEAADCPLAIQAGLRDSACLAAGDAVAIAPYFGNYLDVASNADEIELWTLDDLFAEISQGGQLQDDMASSNTPCTDNTPQVPTLPCPISALEEITAWITSQKAAADARGLRLLAYEGGQHLVGVQGVENNDTITALFVDANRDNRMAAIYADYLQRWKDNGGELFVHFNLSFGYGRFGNWGALETLNPQVATAPKQQAIIDFNAANPCWWSGCGLDGASPPPPPPPSCPQLVLDSSFEATGLDNLNPNWGSTSTAFGTALCDTAISACADDPNAPGTVGPRSGTAWTWFGVDAGNEVATVSQTITLPDDGARHLHFFVRRGFISSPFDATLEVRLGGTLLQTLTEPSSPEAAYAGFDIDVSAQPRNTPLLLEFRYANGGDGKSNFNLDDISLDCSANGS